MFTHTGNTIPLAPPQDPNVIDTWGADWTEYLLPGEVINKSVWIIDNDFTTLEETATLTHTSIKFKGGLGGKSYLNTNRIITNLGNILDKSMFIRCMHT